jgi:subtilisin family serine protease
MSAANHRSRVRYALAATLALLAGCADVRQRAVDVTALPKQMRQRQVVVTLASPVAPDAETATQALASRYRLSEAGTFPLDSIRVQCAVLDIPADRSFDEVIATLRGDPQVDSVQPNQFFATEQAQQPDPYAGLEYGATSIRADVAHRVSTGKGVRVIAVDTGADAEHPDLQGRIAKVANFVDGGESTFATDRHGTAVAGIIAAHADNGVGIFGIAPDAELQIAKACWYPDRDADKARCSSWTLAKAIDFAIRENARVLNLSLTGPSDPLLERLLLLAETRGMTVVAAAAEEGAGAGFPASMPTVIAVIASDATGIVRRSRWTEDKFAIAAPGVDILTTVPRGGYDFVTGSSFSAAEVSGVVALLLQRKPETRPSEIRDVVQRSARPVAAESVRAPRAATGIIDACAALSVLSGTAACP